jgi:hypothetical protein
MATKGDIKQKIDQGADKAKDATPFSYLTACAHNDAQRSQRPQASAMGRGVVPFALASRKQNPSLARRYQRLSSASMSFAMGPKLLTAAFS